MRILAKARCNFCPEHTRVVEQGNGRICPKCLAEALAFLMKNNKREPESEGDRPPQTSKAS